MECLADYINNSPSLLALIPQCSNTSTQNEFVEFASAFLQRQQVNYRHDELFSHFASFISNELTSSGLKASLCYPSITVAFTQYREHRNEKQNFKKQLMFDLKLLLTPEEYDAELTSIPVYYMDRLSTAYPPLNTWIYETDIVREQ